MSGLGVQVVERLAGLLLISAAVGLFTWMARMYALRHHMIDVPNARSSHIRPIPRGGGIAFVGAFLVLIGWEAWTNRVPADVAAALIGGGFLVALVGWLDDRYTLSAIFRAGIHGVAAIWALAWLGGLESIDLGLARLQLGLLGSFLAFLAVVWSINLYNFMDGIDGIAAAEAVIVSVVAGILLSSVNDSSLANSVWLLAAACAGFLVWNWAPAKIFMGDVGSGFLGYTFSVLALASENRGSLPLLVWAILLAVFIIDATATLMRRIWRGEKWSQPHRSHAYQRAVQVGYSHAQVSIAVIGLDVILGGLAGLAQWLPWALIPVLILVTTVLLVLWYRFGVVQSQELIPDAVAVEQLRSRPR